MRLNSIIVNSLTACILIFGLGQPAGAQWTKVTGLTYGEVLDLEVKDDSLYFTLWDEVYRFNPDVNTPFLMGSLGAGKDIWSLSFAGDRLLAGTFGYGVYESFNKGVNWTARNAGLSGAAARSVSCIATRGDSVYIGTSGAGIYVSTLAGNLSWVPYRKGLDFEISWDIYSLYNWQGILFTGAGINAFISRNMPDSDNWEGYQFGEFQPIGLAMFGFGHFGNLLIGAAYNGIYTSLDSGKTWSYYPAPIIIALSGRILQFENRTLAMLSHLSRGTYIWELKEGNWELFDYQSDLRVFDLVYFKGRLYAGCPDGLYYLKLDSTGHEPNDPNLPSEISLEQNYPNPFNPVTNIEYRLPERTSVSIEVFNSAGQKVATLVDGERPAGRHSIKWDGTDDSGIRVSSGIYLYRLSAGNNSESRKMLLLK